MRVLVTGGAGYIGSVVAEELLRDGHDVVVYDNLAKGHRDAVPAGAAFVHGDLGDGTLLRDALRRHRSEAVVHLAADSLVGESVANPAKYYANNVGNGLALLDAMVGLEIGRLVFSSTVAVLRRAAQDADRGVGSHRSGQSVRRDETRARARAALVRRSLRPPLGEPALLQRGRRQRALGRATRSGDASDPARAPDRGGQAPRDHRLRRRLRNARRHLHSRLHPRERSRARPRTGARGLRRQPRLQPGLWRRRHDGAGGDRRGARGDGAEDHRRDGRAAARRSGPPRREFRARRARTGLARPRSATSAASSSPPGDSRKAGASLARRTHRES